MLRCWVTGIKHVDFCLRAVGKDYATIAHDGHSGATGANVVVPVSLWAE